MTTSSIISAQALGFSWPTVDPFLFCADHDDAYPAGNAHMGPDASLAGREMGQDFSRKDGWSMYHGQQVPEFPGHPHWGFETVTIVRKGLIDHSDSLGAAARFGGGDVQWLTAGRGIVHAEMFPLLHTDAQGRSTDIAVIAGSLPTAQHSVQPLAPPPDSWAATSAGDVAIWTIKMQSGAHYTLPAAQVQGTQRTVYFFKETSIAVDGQALDQPAALQLRADVAVQLVNGDGPAELLLLQGRPMAEPVAQYGPFVMNSQAEVHQTIADYRATEFGGWPWPDNAPVHGREPARFARHPDGRLDAPPVAT